MAQSSSEVFTMPAKCMLNLSIKELVKASLNRKEGELAANEALVVKTGARTGRSPKDRFIVRDSITETAVDWNTINQPLDPAKFEALWQKANAYIETQDEYFVSYLKVGAHDK